MARKGPGGPRTRLAEAVRYASGRIKYYRPSQDEKPVPPSVFSCVQRISAVHPALAGAALREAVGDKSRPPQPNGDAVQEAIEAAREPRLGYPLGKLFLKDLLSPGVPGESNEETEYRKNRALLMEKAGLLYAALHYAVWNGSGAPLRDIPSHLSKVLVAVPAPPSELTPTKLDELRMAREYRLVKCRRALKAAAPMGLALKIVDRVCIEQVDLTEPEAGPGALQAPLKHLRAGLVVLIGVFELDKGTRAVQSAIPPSATESPPATAAAVPPPVRVIKKPRLEVRFGGDSSERPDVDLVKLAVARLKLSALGATTPAGRR
jgi:hypothetical protein